MRVWNTRCRDWARQSTTQFKKNELSLNDRTYTCECGYQEDRDIHSAKNMLVIKNLIVPTEHREVTLMEFNNSVKETGLRT